MTSSLKSSDKDVDFEITSDLAEDLGKFVVNATTRFLEIQHPKIDREEIQEINLKIRLFEKSNLQMKIELLSWFPCQQET